MGSGHLGHGGSSGHDARPNLSASFRSGSPLAEQVLARDIAECSDDDVDEAVADGLLSDAEYSGHIMYRRPSGVAYGASRPIINPQSVDEPAMTPLERKQSRNAERSILRDNHVLPPKHSQKSQTLVARMYRRLFSTKLPHEDEDEADNTEQHNARPSENSPLLSGGQSDYDARRGSDSLSDDVEEQWEEAIHSGLIRTTWQRETKTLFSYCAPLIATFVLQYSINVTGIFVVGRIGKLELGAITCKPKYRYPISGLIEDPSGQSIYMLTCS